MTAVPEIAPAESQLSFNQRELTLQGTKGPPNSFIASITHRAA